MIAEAFNNPWFGNVHGTQPVDDEVLVDVQWSNNTQDNGQRAIDWTWHKDNVPCLTHWRIHQPVDTLEEAFFPRVKANTPMPPCKPPKSDKLGKLSDEDILGAFNKLAGTDVTADQYEMLLSLQEMFDSRS